MSQHADAHHSRCSHCHHRTHLIDYLPITQQSRLLSRDFCQHATPTLPVLTIRCQAHTRSPVSCEQKCVTRQTNPADLVHLAACIQAIQKVVAERVEPICYIIGCRGDLAHAGQKSEEQEGLTPAFLNQVAREDQALLPATLGWIQRDFFRQSLRIRIGEASVDFRRCTCCSARCLPRLERC
jgi:hypothetical protein